MCFKRWRDYSASIPAKKRREVLSTSLRRSIPWQYYTNSDFDVDFDLMYWFPQYSTPQFSYDCPKHSVQQFCLWRSSNGLQRKEHIAGVVHWFSFVLLVLLLLSYVGNTIAIHIPHSPIMLYLYSVKRELVMAHHITYTVPIHMQFRMMLVVDKRDMFS